MTSFLHQRIKRQENSSHQSESEIYKQEFQSAVGSQSWENTASWHC